jgi:hypothetical protein
VVPAVMAALRDPLERCRILCHLQTSARGRSISRSLGRGFVTVWCYLSLLGMERPPWSLGRRTSLIESLVTNPCSILATATASAQRSGSALSATASAFVSRLSTRATYPSTIF